MKSMTGFAQGRHDFEKFSVSYKIKSLNHRFLDINFKGNGITPAFEKLMRGIIKNKIFRGKVEIIFDLFLLNPRKWDIQFNEGLLGEILDKFSSFKKKYKENFNLSIDSLLKIPMIFHLDYAFDNFDKKDIERIKTSFWKVFYEFLSSREAEGSSIFNDLLSSINKVEKKLKNVEKEATQIEKDIFKKYKDKITKFLKGSEIDERRIAQEAAIAAEKVCINEEINRLKTHCKRLRQLLRNDRVYIKGKEADFLSQEMQRESYTIASKITSIEVHKNILQIRREIEKIRQQVQNVE